jgi:hypothetical protein
MKTVRQSHQDSGNSCSKTQVSSSLCPLTSPGAARMNPSLATTATNTPQPEEELSLPHPPPTKMPKVLKSPRRHPRSESQAPTSSHCSSRSPSKRKQNNRRRHKHNSRHDEIADTNPPFSSQDIASDISTLRMKEAMSTSSQPMSTKTTQYHFGLEFDGCYKTDFAYHCQIWMRRPESKMSTMLSRTEIINRPQSNPSHYYKFWKMKFGVAGNSLYQPKLSRKSQEPLCHPWE